ncbi:MAG: membrane dipeptidase, partial [bacterium]
GIGSDFDGTSALPIGLEDVSKFPNLFAELIRRGWSDADLKKLAGENLLRVLRAAEATAQRLQKIRPPSTATIEKLDGPQTNLQYDTMAAKIADALKLRKDERVLIRFDPGYFNELVEPLRRHIRTAGAVEVGALEYIESATIRNGVRSDNAQPRVFEQLLETVDVYLWLPVRTDLREIPAPESQALQRWLDKGGARRQIHFHWSQGSVLADGLAGEHSAALDSVYKSALDIDYATLSTTQDRAITLLRSGTVRVHTPAGTDLNFRIGERPFNKQNGDASTERAQKAVVRIDREIELPAGVVRVAPLEETVNGRIVIPSARFGDKTARQLKLEINHGRVIRVEADENLTAVEAALNAGGEAARRFREFALGFNPKLVAPAASPVLPYFGYGAGVVRLSLGDNQELGGSVRGNFVRWFFFPDATVEVNGRVLVREGKLVKETRQN